MHELEPYPDLLHRLHGLLADQFDVESRRQDEDEHGSSGGACVSGEMCHILYLMLCGAQSRTTRQRDTYQ